jgi:ABC-type lipoprotein release transport system permease subunit
MRAIGASDGTIMQRVIFEGMLVGVISWIPGVLLALVSFLPAHNAARLTIREALAYEWHRDVSFRIGGGMSGECNLAQSLA